MLKLFCLLKLSVGNDLREVGQSSEGSGRDQVKKSDFADIAFELP